MIFVFQSSMPAQWTMVNRTLRLAGPLTLFCHTSRTKTLTFLSQYYRLTEKKGLINLLMHIFCLAVTVLYLKHHFYHFRLKILESLDILKDETLAGIAGTSSVLVFINDSLQSIQTKTMPWLASENSENVLLLKNAENANESYEDKIVVGVLKLLSKICKLSGHGLNVRPFDLIIMDKVVLLANMGHSKQRSGALMVFEQAVKNDLGMRVKSMHKIVWEIYKTTLQNYYCKRMAILVNSGTLDWASLWETTITFIGTDLHRGSGLVNSLLKVEEHAFRSADPNRR